MSEKSIFEQAVECWGPVSQVGMVNEEAGELITVLNQWIRGRVSASRVAEEVADMSIVLDQIPHIVEAISRARNGQFVEKAEGFESMTSYYRKMKLQRLRQRVELVVAKLC